jgi:hypothetical protein
MSEMLLETSLNDHLAEATAEVKLARRTARSNRDLDYGPFLAELTEQTEQNRRSLLTIMSRLKIGFHRLKVIAGWTGEKLGREAKRSCARLLAAISVIPQPRLSHWRRSSRPRPRRSAT